MPSTVLTVNPMAVSVGLLAVTVSVNVPPLSAPLFAAIDNDTVSSLLIVATPWLSKMDAPADGAPATTFVRFTRTVSSSSLTESVAAVTLTVLVVSPAANVSVVAPTAV